MSATVRVGGGTGVFVANRAHTVVVTANHVVAEAQRRERDAPIRVRSAAGWSECSVLARDEAADLAILAAPLDADGRGLELLDREMVPGEELWTCGHPRGWKNTEANVLCRGIVGGIAGEERWANLEASWGSSGGAMALAGGEALVGGVALGKADDAQDALVSFQTRLAEVRDYHAKESLRFDELRREIWKSDRDHRETQADVNRRLETATGDEARDLVTEFEGAQWRRSHSQLVALVMGLRELSNNTYLKYIAATTDLVELHFRTGFVRFAGVTAIRKLLGDG